MSQTYFQKGFNLKAVVGPVLAQNYHSRVVERLKELDHAARAGDLVLKLAREFGFCYGVDRAVEYAYETRERFPDRRIFLSGEIIHNPDVNGRIGRLGIRSLPEKADPTARYAEVAPEDVVSLPAFGVPVAEMEVLRAKGCVLVDTTCGSVLNVWKNVHLYAREGFTSVIHGKHHHEETKATASQALTHAGGHYLCVRDRDEADDLRARFRAFDTICSATQDRQDAVLKMLDAGGLDLMVVIGGYNSSNTQALARICGERLPTFHISGPDGLEGRSIRHHPVGTHDEVLVAEWLPAGPVTVGLTAGASTPNNVVGEVVERILA